MIIQIRRSIDKLSKKIKSLFLMLQLGFRS
jgi:hypothetical protein